MPNSISLRWNEQRGSLKGFGWFGRTSNPTIQRGQTAEVFHNEKRSDHDNGFWGICKERSLDYRKFDFVQESNDSGVFSETSMPSPQRGDNIRFSGLVWVVFVFWERFQNFKYSAPGKGGLVILLLYSVNSTKSIF